MSLLLDYPPPDGLLSGYGGSASVPVAWRGPGIGSFRRGLGIGSFGRGLGIGSFGRGLGIGSFRRGRVGSPVLGRVGSSGRRRPGSADRGRAIAVTLTVATVALGAGLLLPRSSGASGGGDNSLPALPPGSRPHQTDAAPSPTLTAPRTVRPTVRPSGSAGPGSQPVMTERRHVVAPRPSAPVAAKPAIVVRYLVASQGPGGFQGEIEVTNHTAHPLGNWQIVVALDGDAVTSFTNAAGYVSNGILLLGPASPAEVAPSDGGVIDVFFVAEGTQTTPVACAFNGIPCS